MNLDLHEITTPQPGNVRRGHMVARKNPLKVGLVFSSAGSSTRQLREYVDRFDRQAGDGDVRRYQFPESDPFLFLYFDPLRQPDLKSFFHGDGSFLVLDGEIYNLQELATAAGIREGDEAETLFDLFRSQCDGLLEQIDSIASLIIWDAPRGRLLVLRDRWGAVPGFYKIEDGILCWSSSLPGLLKVVGYQGVNLPAMDYYLGTGHIPAPWTLAKGISKVKPAHLISASREAIGRVERYWRPTGKPKLELSPEETSEQLDFLLKQSIRRRVKDTENIGVLISGGVDSKLLAAEVKDIGCQFETFTFRYTDYEGDFNEGFEAGKAAKHLGVHCSEIDYGPGDVRDNLDWMIRSYGEPFGFGLHSSMINRIGTDGAVTLLNGAGPDRWYQHLWERLSLQYRRLPRVAQYLGVQSLPVLQSIGSASWPSQLAPLYHKIGRLAHGGQIITWGAERQVTPRFIGIINPEPYREVMHRDKSWVSQAHEEIRAILEETCNEFAGESDEDKLAFTAQQYFPSEGILSWNHWWGEAAGIQIRFPYFDRDLCAFAMRLPRAGKDKDDIRRLARQHLGEEMSQSPKIGQTIPLQGWFRNQLQDFVRDQLSPDRVIWSGLFDPKTVEAMLDQHIDGTADHAWHIWPAIAVLKWQDLATSGDW